MKKVIKIKESAVLGIINKIMLEQATAVATKEVPVSGEIGTTPTYDGFKTLLKTLKINVEKELRGGTPFKVKNGGVKFSRSGNSLNISVALEQCADEQRYWYFDIAGAIFSYATDDASLRSALDNKLIDKARYFGGIPNSKKHLLKTNIIDISALKGIDPKAPEKTFTMLVGYVVGEMPEGVQALAGEEPIAKAETNTVKQTAQQSSKSEMESIKDGAIGFIGVRSIDNKRYNLIFDKTIETYSGNPAIHITGPGTYEGKKLDGTTAFDLTVRENGKNAVLSGNEEMGSFRIVDVITKDGEGMEQILAKQDNAPQTNTSTQKNAGITKTLSGTFETADGDSAHNFKELETKLGNALSEMYKAGTNPKIKSVTAKITKNGVKFSTSYSAEIGPSDDGKAWMGFTARGSFGTDYEKRADGQISGSENKDGRSLEEKLKGIGAGEVAVIGQPYVDTSVPVKEYFVQFTKPKEFPPHQ